MSVCPVKSCALSRGRACRQMNTDTNVHTENGALAAPLKSGHWAKSVSRHTRHYWETKDLHEKGDSLLSSPSLRVCVSLHVSTYLFNTNTTVLWMRTKSSLRFFSFIDPNSEVGLDCLPASMQMNPSTFTSIHTLNPSWNVSLDCVMNMYSPGYCFNCRPVVQIQKLSTLLWTIFA